MKYSNFRFLLEYLCILFCSYLFITGIVAFISDINYRELLCSYGQMYALFLIYWWIPVPRMVDMQKHNSKTLNNFSKPNG
jgi:hypothetical protein